MSTTVNGRSRQAAGTKIAGRSAGGQFALNLRTSPTEETLLRSPHQQEAKLQATLTAIFDHYPAAGSALVEVTGSLEGGDPLETHIVGVRDAWGHDIARIHDLQDTSRGHASAEWIRETQWSLGEHAEEIQSRFLLAEGEYEATDDSEVYEIPLGKPF